MPNPYRYPALGTPLRKVTAATGNAIDGAAGTTVPAGGYTEIFAFQRDPNFSVLFHFASAASGTMIIEECIDKDASVTGETFDTVVVSAERISRWNAGEALIGLGRVKNNTDKSCTIYLGARQSLS